MAIMGTSGAGKSTLLDILARKRKRGDVTGTALVNGREVDDDRFKKVVVYVDQEDSLTSTLMVYETVLYSALLRLPREMNDEAKNFRMLEMLEKPGILGIKDMRIDDNGHRSISGGEKRRLSIACGLVTSPSILFLYEPTSGLDAFDAFNVVESLASLSWGPQSHLFFTIDQLSSNIVSLFDQLRVLGRDEQFYDYFAGIGYPCPPGFNIADFLTDLTTKARSVPNVTDDIAGFQNPFLGLFAKERILFTRERSNGYYCSFTYFASKILFDILPLRLVPPLIFGGIVYGLVEFIPNVVAFWKFLLAIFLFNLTKASVHWLSIDFASFSVANLVGTFSFFNLLFTGLLINRNSMSVVFRWLYTLSFFHAAFKALVVNESKSLQLNERKYGVELDVPAAIILSTFGLRAQSYWWPNITLLGIFATFTTASVLTLHFYVKKKR